MLRVVFDTMVFVRCLINPASIWGSLVFRRTNRYLLFLSEPVREEILEVIDRPEISRRFSSVGGLNRDAVIAFVQRAEMVAIGVPPTVSRDPKDNKFLATAKAAQAAYLVSEDQDLLVLREYEGTAIVTTVQFLQILRNDPRSE